MSGSINKVILVGRAGADAETRSFTNGGKVASFSMATSDVWTDKDSGERKEKVQWHRVSVLNEAKAEICGKYVKKGTLVSVVGRLENRDYEKNGTKVAVTEVVLRPYEGEVALLDSPSKPETKGQGRAAERSPR